MADNAKMYRYKVLMDNPTEGCSYIVELDGVEHKLDDFWFFVMGLNGDLSCFALSRVMQFDRVPVEQE